MKSKISFCKKELVINNLRMYGVVSVLWGIFLFLVFPLVILGWDWSYLDLGDIKSLLLSPLIISAGIFGAILGLVLFHFLKTDQGVAFHLSLPATKNQVFFSQVLSALLLGLVPVLVNGGLLVLALLVKNPSLLGFDLIRILASWFSLMALFFTLNFLISLALGLMTGAILWNIIFIGIYYVLPVFFYVSSALLGSNLLKGYYQPDYEESWIYQLDLMARTLNITLHKLEELGAYMTFLGLYILVVGILAFILYKYKKMEENRDWIAFDFLKIVFIIGFTACFSITMGAIFNGIFWDEGKGVLYWGVGLGAVLGYIIAAMIAWKTIYLKKAWLGTGAALVLALTILVGIDLDILGYEHYQARPEEVSLVRIHMRHGRQGRIFLLDSLITTKDTANAYGGYMNTYEFGQTDNIVKIEEIHKQLIDKDEKEGQYIELDYYLKNGKKVSRRYRGGFNPENETYQSLIKTEEALKQKYPALDQKLMQDLVEIRVGNSTNRSEEAFTGQKMQELLALAQREIRRETNNPEKAEITGPEGNQVMLLRHAPIRLDFIVQSSQEVSGYDQVLAEEAWEEDSIKVGASDEDVKKYEYSLFFYGQAQDLRAWLEQESELYGQVELRLENIAQVELAKSSAEDLYSLSIELRAYNMNRYFEADFSQNDEYTNEVVINPVQIADYLDRSGYALNDEDEPLMAMRVRFENGDSLYRAMTLKDYHRLRQKYGQK